MVHQFLAKGQRHNASWAVTSEGEKKAIAEGFPARAVRVDKNASVAGVPFVEIEVFEAAGQTEPSFTVRILLHNFRVKEGGKGTLYTAPVSDRKLYDRLIAAAVDKVEQ